MSAETEYIYKKIIILESFYGIGRPYLLQGRKTRLVCEIITITVLIVVTTAIIADIFSDVKIGSRILCVTGLELFCLAILARYRTIMSNIVDRLEIKCQLNEKSLLILKTKGINSIAVTSVVSFIIDIIGMKLLNVYNATVIVLGLSFAAHEAELGYFALLFETMNARLEMLKDATPKVGAKRYGYILIAASHLSERCTPVILFLLASTLLTTISYQFILILVDTETVLSLSLYLIWRETRSMYTLWILCKAVAKSGTICQNLSLRLVKLLTLDENYSKEKKLSQYNILHRWHSILVTQQPRYISGTILSIGLSTPVLLIDLSINYMLIIVQMYLAYK